MLLEKNLVISSVGQLIMIWVAVLEKRGNICNFFLLMAPASYFQMTHIDPENCQSDCLDPLREQEHWASYRASGEDSDLSVSV